MLSEAIVLFVGYGKVNWPQPDEKRVVERFGPEVAIDLLPPVNRLIDEFYASDAHLTARGLVEMVDRAEERFRTLHPELA